MIRLLACLALVCTLGCGDDDGGGGGGPSCEEVCRVVDDCGFPISSCVASCPTATTREQRECIVAAGSCDAANVCFPVDDAGP